MRIQCFLVLQIDLIFICLEQVESNFVSIRLDRIRKVLDLEWHIVLLDKLNRQSETSSHDEDSNYLLWIYPFTMSFQEVEDVIVREYYIGVNIVFIFTLISNKHRYEVNEPDDCHLVLVDLCLLDQNQLVAVIILDQQLAVVFHDECDHAVVMRFQQAENVFSSEIKIGIFEDGYL